MSPYWLILAGPELLLFMRWRTQRLVHIVVHPSLVHQFLVGSHLHDSTILQNYDPVSMGNGG